MDNLKIGDLVGNTVQGFNFEVVEIYSTQFKVHNLKTNETFLVDKNSMYAVAGLGLLIVKSKIFFND
jgi:hypothetical protein